MRFFDWLGRLAARGKGQERTRVLLVLAVIWAALCVLRIMLAVIGEGGAFSVVWAIVFGVGAGCYAEAYRRARRRARSTT
jgi:hypothetical protein